MKVILICAQSNTEEWLEAAEALYLKKLKHFISFEVVRLKNKKLDRDSKVARIKSDSELILNSLMADDAIVLFDERGAKLSSEQHADKLQNLFNSGKKRIVFIIGGPYGVDDSVKKRAQLNISLSSLVFNHMVAEVVALEQIYRSFTILKNIPYHNE